MFIKSYQVTVAVQHDSWAVYRLVWRSWSVVNSVCLLDVLSLLSAQGMCRFSICRCLAKSLDSTNWIDMETSELVGRCTQIPFGNFGNHVELSQTMRDWFHLIPLLLFKLQFPHWDGDLKLKAFRTGQEEWQHAFTEAPKNWCSFVLNNLVPPLGRLEGLETDKDDQRISKMHALQKAKNIFEIEIADYRWS